jgi:predicted transcriptional regulator
VPGWVGRRVEGGRRPPDIQRNERRRQDPLTSGGLSTGSGVVPRSRDDGARGVECRWCAVAWFEGPEATPVVGLGDGRGWASTIHLMVSSLGELERAVMEVLWDRPTPVAVRDVAEALAPRELAYTTVMTVLDRLAKKGFVHRQRDGRAWRYEPANSREEYVAQLMLDALALTGDRDAALTRFARSVSVPEAEVLSQALAEAHQNDDPTP